MPIRRPEGRQQFAPREVAAGAENDQGDGRTGASGHGQHSCWVRGHRAVVILRSTARQGQRVAGRTATASPGNARLVRPRPQPRTAGRFDRLTAIKPAVAQTTIAIASAPEAARHPPAAESIPLGPAGNRLSLRHSSASTLRTARNASCGISTFPTCFIRFFPSFCFSRSFLFLVISPP